MRFYTRNLLVVNVRVLVFLHWLGFSQGLGVDRRWRTMEIYGYRAMNFIEVVCLQAEVFLACLWNSYCKVPCNGLGQHFNAFTPPPFYWRYLCLCPGSALLQNYINPRVAEP